MIKPENDFGDGLYGVAVFRQGSVVEEAKVEVLVVIEGRFRGVILGPEVLRQR